MNVRLLLIALTTTALLQNASAQTEAIQPAATPAAEADSLDDYGDYSTPEISDPLEPVNRVVFKFNDFVYEEALWPAARGYEIAVPPDVRYGVSNFFYNLRYPVRLVSSLLQGKFTRAGQETSKFIVNSTIGMGGLFRMSDLIPELNNVPGEDLGQTFGTWKIGPGPYIVLPLFGGSSSRDLVGRIGDTYISPLGWQYAEWNNREWTGEFDWETQTVISATDTISSLPGGLRLYRELKGSALDHYIAVRNGTLAYRKQQVAK